MLNTFRLIGDAIHLFSFVILLFKIWVNSSSAGVSGKTQILLALVFSTRYLDLFTVFVSTYNYDMKIIFICLSYATVISIYLIFKKTYQKEEDTLRIEFLIVAALIMALVVDYKFEALEVFWTFSIYLEAVAAWPQFYMISKSRKVLTSVFFYLLAVGVYRIFYILNWAYRYYYEDHVDLISSVSGTVQVIPFLVFWGCCLCGVVVITSKERSFYNANQDLIFTIKLRDEESQKGKDELSLLSNEEKNIETPVNFVQI